MDVKEKREIYGGFRKVRGSDCETAVLKLFVDMSGCATLRPFVRTYWKD